MSVADDKWLKKQSEEMREVVRAIAHRDPGVIPVSEVAESTRLHESTVAALLQKLKENGYLGTMYGRNTVFARTEQWKGLESVVQHP